MSIAILIDGSFFLKRHRYVYGEDKKLTPDEVAERVFKVCQAHVKRLNEPKLDPARKNNPLELYRIYFYDCHPYAGESHNPITKEHINFKSTDQYQFRSALLECLKRKRKVALRMGKVAEKRRGNNWSLTGNATKDLLKGKLSLDRLTKEDVSFQLNQKGVDIKIGLDIASIAYKKLAKKIVLITGDSDFVPAAKLARREGIDFILDPMGMNVSEDLFEHIDGLQSVKLK